MESEAKSEKAVEIERRYLYRKMILTGKIKVPRKVAFRMIGPDCAYHLYATHRTEKNPEKS